MYGVVIIMKNPLYITSHGILSRKNNTLYFIKEDVKKQIPIHAISEINCFGKVTIKSGAASFLMKEGIVVNFFNKYGFYEGSLYPKIKLNSGLIVVKQSKHYLDIQKREYLAKEFVEGIKHNVLKTMKYYSNKGKNLDEFIDNICEEAPIFIDVLKDDSISGDFMAVSADGVNGKTITTDGKIYRYDDAGVKRQVDAITSDNVNDYTVLVNCYTLAANENKAMELQINAEDFAGYFYVEADTLVRRQSDGRDLPAILTIPLVKIKSNFSITMASSGDPSGLMRLAA